MFNKFNRFSKFLPSTASITAWLALGNDPILTTLADGTRELVNSKGDNVLSTTGQILSFNGIDEEVHVGYLVGVTCDTFIVNVDGGTSGYLMKWKNIIYPSGGVITLFYDGANHNTTISTPTKGQICVVRESTATLVYLDGVLHDILPTMVVPFGNNDLTLGSGKGGAYSNTALGDFRAVKEALTPEQVLDVYNNPESTFKDMRNNQYGVTAEILVPLNEGIGIPHYYERGEDKAVTSATHLDINTSWLFKKGISDYLQKISFNTLMTQAYGLDRQIVNYETIVDLGCPPITGTTYYVDASTEGTQVGTEENPFKTLTQVNAQLLSAGDGMLFKKGETFNGILQANSSGTITDRIVYGAYGTGERPIITVVEEQALGWTDQGGNIWKCTTNNPINDPKRIKRNGIEIMRKVSSDLGLGDTVPDLVEWDYLGSELYVYNDPTNDTFQYSIESSTMYEAGRSYIDFYGIKFSGGRDYTLNMYSMENCSWHYIDFGEMAYKAFGLTQDTQGNGNFIDNCIFDSRWLLNYKESGIGADSNRGAYEGLAVLNDLDGIDITNCYFKNWQHASINIWANPVTLKEIQNVRIKYNTFTSPDTPYGGRLALQGNTHDYEVSHNISIDQIGSRWQLESYNGHTHNNIFISMADSMIDIEGSEGSAIRLGDWNSYAHDNLLENNLFYKIQPNAIDAGATGTFADGRGMRNTTIRNNIFYECHKPDFASGAPIYLRNMNYPTYNDNMTVNNNLSYSITSTDFGKVGDANKTDVTTFESELNATATCSASGNTTSDPMFINHELYNFIPLVGSPLLNVGVQPLAINDFYNGYIYSPFNIGTYNGIAYTGTTMHISTDYNQIIAVVPTEAYTVKWTTPNNTTYELSTFTTNIDTNQMLAHMGVSDAEVKSIEIV